MTSTTTDRLAGVTAGLSSKAPVRAASTGALTLSGLKTIDSVVLVADDRVLVKDQADGIQNGIYNVKSGAWVRSSDFDGTRDIVSGTFVVVTEGTAGTGTAWRISTTGTITVGTTSIDFARAVWSSADGVEVTATGSTTARSLALRFADIFNVRDYGAVGDGVTDDTAAIQTAINAAGAVGGGIVYFPLGTYLISSALVINVSNIQVEGSGSSAAIKTNSTTADVFTVGDGITRRDNISVKDISIDSSVTKTAGAGIHFNLAGWSRVNNLRISKMFNGIHVEGNSVALWIGDTDIRSTTAATGVGILIEGGNDHYLNTILIDNPSGSKPLAGIRITQSQATWIQNCSVLNCVIGLSIDPGAGQIITWLFIINSAFDNCGDDGIRLNAGTATSSIRGCTFTACWSSTNGGRGFLTTGVAGGVIDGVFVSAHRSYNNATDGYLFTFGENIQLDHCQAAGNSTATPGSVHGITIAANISEFAIRGCRSGESAGFGTTQAFGVVINAGTGDNYQVIGNDLRGNSTGGLADNAAGSVVVILGNLGHVTENSGTGSIASGTTADTITHGLAVTPAAKDISVTFTESPDTDPGNIWVDTITSTQFNVNCRTDPGASNLDFAWNAHVLP